MNTDIIAECMKLSFADTPFPKVVANLIGAGVRSYHADLAALRNTYYGAGGASYDEPLPLVPRPAVAATFDMDAVATRRPPLLGWRSRSYRSAVTKRSCSPERKRPAFDRASCCCVMDDWSSSFSMNHPAG